MTDSEDLTHVKPSSKGRAPSMALKVMEKLREDLALRKIIIDHWRQVPNAVIEEIDRLHHEEDQMMLRLAQREDELRQTLADYDALIGENNVLRQSLQESQKQIKHALGWRSDVAGSVPDAILKLRKDLTSLVAELEEARATKDMHKERYEQLLLETTTKRRRIFPFRFWRNNG